MKKLRVGLTMAGAVSAGAFTGGTLDYFFQAMDAWENAKRLDRDDIPRHEVSIEVISGASAGGITAAMAAIALHMDHRNPAIMSRRLDDDYLKNNIFYNAWVNLTAEDMLPEMLDLNDIVEENKLTSILNSSFIEKIASRVFQKLPINADVPPRYVSKELELVLTLSNLQGFTYNLKFNNNRDFQHLMTQHRDYAFFRLGNEYRNDGRIPLDLTVDNCGLSELLQSAMGTGAFPIGLSYRKFVRQKRYILDNPDLVYYKPGFTDFGELSKPPTDSEFVSYNVDGGLLNNEPFDLTIKLLSQKSNDPTVKSSEELNPKEDSSDATIIMIDPFPSEESLVDGPLNQHSLIQNNNKSIFARFPYDLIDVLGKVYSAARGELLFKGEEIVKAFAREDFSRFIIAPRRHKLTTPDKTISYNGSKAIACGALGGFAGFFDKEFRKHDFYLGRANCQSFLRKYFRTELDQNLIPINDIIAAGYTPAAIKKFKFQDDEEIKMLGPDKAPWYVPIIPDCSIGQGVQKEIPMDYPKYDMLKFNRHKGILLRRLKTILKSFGSNFSYRILLSAIFLFASKRLFKKITTIVTQDFRKWDLLR